MMTDFSEILEPMYPWNSDQSYIPYAHKKENGEWRDGGISISFLQDHFGQYNTAEEMINATNSEGLKLYFQWLRDQGKLD